MENVKKKDLERQIEDLILAMAKDPKNIDQLKKALSSGGGCRIRLTLNRDAEEQQVSMGDIMAFFHEFVKKFSLTICSIRQALSEASSFESPRTFSKNPSGFRVFRECFLQNLRLLLSGLFLNMVHSLSVFWQIKYSGRQ